MTRIDGMGKIKWGIIGCGDVAEVKSGPAFQNVPNSELVAVMRRNGHKARDFAQRHNVPQWFDKVNDIIDNSGINAVYIATPPSTHLQYAMLALNAEKHVYLEKPMTMDSQESLQLVEAVRSCGRKLTVAHYRRKLPAFLKVKELLDAGSIGAIRLIDLQILQPQKSDIIATTEVNWRIDPAISGGGYFHDLAPHQIDLMCQFFGPYQSAKGISHCQNKAYNADDVVNGLISFKNGVQFSGCWCFNVSEQDKRDQCVIYGSKGSISFSFYGEKISLKTNSNEQIFRFKNPPNIQQPMIRATVDYFLDRAPNPCSVEEGFTVMELMDCFCFRGS
ncbi:Gfo/Idh/MocA family oxidoreductase [Flavobacteriaceae bacterium F89]|uniref:Gfo/Idh/MocA family oxidoreductase n=1 Tax=Cerina litoralis TaxID=2874477 RepID=A0AAE3ES76_9FLAO|nr:Gfo/Idh/MocA family oxidoreductase [Cerina litoralis]MCG2460257.1 Gfo/Idh/MocA family oxidoreductase [Cerina litoralis]